MRLRIISGLLRGRILQSPDKQLLFRPTLERTRKSIADMLQPRISGSATADLCAGSGSFGFEMLSRGAASVEFVENDRRCATLLRDHAEKFGVAGQCRIAVQDVAVFARSSTRQYDIIFFDPPYEAEGMAALVPLLRGLLLPGGIVLFQRRRNSGSQESEKPFETRTFGDTVVECYGPRIA
jgi:16S rRNA (guanine(966)-N(2))-methyltransferase RsmD